MLTDGATAGPAASGRVATTVTLWSLYAILAVASYLALVSLVGVATRVVQRYDEAERRWRLRFYETILRCASGA